jgi:hypothetical protein
MKQRKRKIFASAGTVLYLGVINAQTVLAKPDKSMYDGSTGNKNLDSAGDTILKMVGGGGATVFALAFMIIGLFLAFGSLNPQRSSALWKAFFVCAGAAFVFFMAYLLPDIMKNLAIGGGG